MFFIIEEAKETILDFFTRNWESIINFILHVVIDNSRLR